MEILDFKSLSPLYEQCRDGVKMFDFRLDDKSDSRFCSLRLPPFYRANNPHWYIRFTNPATGESFIRRLRDWTFVRDPHGFPYEPKWIIMHLGEMADDIAD
jgi:hypothetical protein